MYLPILLPTTFSWFPKVPFLQFPFCSEKFLKPHFVFRGGLLISNSFSFPFPGNVLISSLFLKDICTGFMLWFIVLSALQKYCVISFWLPWSLIRNVLSICLSPVGKVSFLFLPSSLLENSFHKLNMAWYGFICLLFGTFSASRI